jgi:hypothetical protein
MLKQISRVFLIVISVILVLTACSSEPSTEDWTVFAIEEEPAIDIQFRLPPDWYVDYMPTAETPGKWEIVLLPPFCEKDQETEYTENCVAVTIYIKVVAAFDKEATIQALAQSVASYNTNQTDAIPLAQDTFEVNGIPVQRFDRKISLGEKDILISFHVFESDSADYIFVSEFPSDESDLAAALAFEQMIQSIEIIE